MKRHVKFLTAAIAVLLSVAVTAANAQTASRASVPFAFSANRQVLPPGNYQIALDPGGFLSITNRASGKIVELAARTSYAEQDILHGSLVFHVIDGQYRLTSVRFAHANLESDLAIQRSKAERELESRKFEVGSR